MGRYQALCRLGLSCRARSGVSPRRAGEESLLSLEWITPKRGNAPRRGGGEVDAEGARLLAGTCRPRPKRRTGSGPTARDHRLNGLSEEGSKLCMFRACAVDRLLYVRRQSIVFRRCMTKTVCEAIQASSSAKPVRTRQASAPRRPHLQRGQLVAGVRVAALLEPLPARHTHTARLQTRARVGATARKADRSRDSRPIRVTGPAIRLGP